MQVGSALQAPEGHHTLEAGLTYYFLRSNRIRRIVQFVHFAYDERWLAHLYSLPRKEFEDCLLRKRIIPVNNLNGFPPFLQVVQGLNLREFDLQRQNAVLTHTERVDDRLQKIAPLLELKNEILNSYHPEREINKYATEQGLNAQRTRFWFFTYLCFGENSWMLFPHYFNCGHWDRALHPTGPKWGRPSIARGKHAGGRLSAQTIELIVRSYKNLCQEGRTMTSIYQEAMTKFFKAQVTTNEHGHKRLISSDSNPIPTIDQYRYQLEKAIGKDTIQLLRWGAPRYRRSTAAHKGKFSSSVSNLLERVEADAYYCEERPRSFQGNDHLSPLCVTRFVDVASGLRTGIGFSFIKENSESYNAALFCAAISKKKFCSLFGIDIEEAEWPSQGLSPHSITDRGPGIKREPGHNNQPGLGLVIREFTPSGQGQSKALVESAQRRVTSLEGPTQFSLSSLTVCQLAVREIRRLIAENDTANAREHMTPDMTQEQIMPTPLGVWNFLDARARNDGQLIPFDSAVRRFLKKTTVRVARDGVWLRAQRYRSPALLDTNFLNRISSIGQQQLTAYILPMCVRYIWVEVDNQLIEVAAQLNLRDDEDMLYRTEEDLVLEEKQQNQSLAELRQHRPAAIVDQQQKFKTENDASWHSGTTTKTPLKRSHATRLEETEIRAVLAGRGDEDND